MGAVQGDLTSEATDPAGRLRDVGLGALGGKAGSMLGGGVKSAIWPTIRPEAQWAADNGIRLTPGGIAGGIPKNLETAATKGTIAGPVIGAAQRRGIDDFNLATIQKNALDPAGLTLPEGIQPGHEAVNEATKALGGSYDALTPNLVLTKDADLLSAVKAANDAAKGLPAAYRNRLTAFTAQLGGKPGLALSGDQVQELTSTLRQEAADAQRSGDFFTAPYGRALDELNSAVGSALERSNPAYAEKLRGLNQGYAALVRIQKAAGNAVHDEGVFTPKGLLTAVRSTDQSARDNATARGEALLQDWANKGKAVLPDKLPSGGNIWTHLPELLVTAGVGHESGVKAIGGMLAGEGALAGAYTPAVQDILRTAMTQRPAVAKPISDVVARLAPFMGQGGAMLASKAAWPALQPYVAGAAP
jgi:hypothetical protein